MCRSYFHHLRFSLRGKPIEFTLIPEVGDEFSVDREKNLIELTHSDPTKGEPPLSFQLKFTNTTDIPLYFSILYLDQQFGIHTGFLQPNTVKLEPTLGRNNFVYANAGAYVRMRMPYHVHHLNWPVEVVYFKLITSTKPFNLSIYHQKPLDAPDRNFRDPAKGFEIPENIELGDKWTVQLVEFRLKNPVYTAENT